MILNVSGRTDIVAFYSEWFIKRFKEGFVDVRNPFNKKLVSRIFFEDVDLIVFCTKNPIPIIKYIDMIEKPILFQVTLTSYKNDIEINVKDKKEIIDAIKILSKKLGKENVMVRYDPILLNKKYTIEYHISAFEKLCKCLNGYVETIIVSFIDDYKNVRNNMKYLELIELSNEDYKNIGINFSNIAKKYNMKVQTCAENNNLVEFGFNLGDCVSEDTARRLTGRNDYKIWKSRNNENCHCVEMVDIGEYNTCTHYCRYCYANYDERKVKENIKHHNVNSSLLIGNINEDDIIKRRK